MRIPLSWGNTPKLIHPLCQDLSYASPTRTLSCGRLFYANSPVRTPRADSPLPCGLSSPYRFFVRTPCMDFPIWTPYADFLCGFPMRAFYTDFPFGLPCGLLCRDFLPMRNEKFPMRTPIQRLLIQANFSFMRTFRRRLFSHVDSYIKTSHLCGLLYKDFSSIRTSRRKTLTHAESFIS